MTESILYLPSTPLNILVSCVHALHYQPLNKLAKKELWLIDQKTCSDNLYINALKNWQESPFCKLHVLCGNQKGLAKLKERKNNFKWLKTELDRLIPTKIFTGSDRRVEFQYAMHIMKNLKTEGGYLDDGLYSYAGRKNIWYKDLVSSFLKKISYGLWWQEPKTVGASSNIQQVHLFQPEVALEIIKKNKVLSILDAKLFLDEKIIALSQQVLMLFAEKIETYQVIDVLIFIPHPNNVAKMQGYLPRLEVLLNKLKQKDKVVAIKYHPRVGMGDPLNLKRLGVDKIIPAELASEFLLPVLPKKCMVLGDVGTALLTCHWLRPDIDLKAILSAEDKFQKGFIPVMKKMGVSIVSSVEEIEF